jgi:hypothetical protein
MNFRVFYTDIPLPMTQTEPDLESLVPLQFPTKDAAIEAAIRMLGHKGAIVWQIDGPESFLLNRSEVEAIYRSRTGKYL